MHIFVQYIAYVVIYATPPCSLAGGRLGGEPAAQTKTQTQVERHTHTHTLHRLGDAWH